MKKKGREAKLRAHNLMLCDDAFEHILNRLHVARHPIKLIVRPSYPIAKAHEIVLPEDIALPLLLYYNEKTAEALETNDAKLASLSGILAGQASMRVALAEIIERGHSVTVSGGKRIATKKQKRDDANSNFEFYVFGKFLEYEIKQKAKNLPATWNDFRESVIRPAIPRMLKSKYREDRQVGRRLMGKAGTNGDGVMSTKQLQRAYYNRASYR
jgi:hypothetical protein